MPTFEELLNEAQLKTIKDSINNTIEKSEKIEKQSDNEIL